MVIARGLAQHLAPPADPATRRTALVILVLVLVQIYLGGLVAGLDAALGHQAMALVVLGFAAAHWRGTRGAYPLPKRAPAAVASMDAAEDQVHVLDGRA